jgi:solute carrier family 45, member 1/2/4
MSCSMSLKEGGEEWGGVGDWTPPPPPPPPPSFPLSSLYLRVTMADMIFTVSRMSSVGQVIGYASGATDLLQIFGTTLGATQFQQLTVIAALAMTTTNLLTCWAVTERVLVSSSTTSSSELARGRRFLGVFRQIWSTVLNLPPRVSAICWVQFWSWIGWFPFMFYSTTWVGETYFRYDATPEDRASDDILGTVGRIGSTSLVIYSTITFSSAFLLPLFVKSPADKDAVTRPLAAVAGRLRSLGGFKPDLLTTWIAGQLGFSIAMSMAPFATSYRFATVLVCLCGM